MILPRKFSSGRRSDNIDASGLPNSSSESLCPKVFRAHFGHMYPSPMMYMVGKLWTRAFSWYLKKNYMDLTGCQNFGDAPGQIPKLILTLCPKWKTKVKFILLFWLFGASLIFGKNVIFQSKFHFLRHKTFLDVCSKNNWMCIFTKKFRTFDPHLPIVFFWHLS